MNVAVNDGSEIADLMQYFKDSTGTNNKFVKLSSRVNYFKHEKEGVKIMATLFEKYVTEATAEEQHKGIRNMARLCTKCKYSPEMTKDEILEAYPNVDEGIITAIIDEVYGLVK